MTLLGLVLLGIGGTDVLRVLLKKGAVIGGVLLWAALLLFAGLAAVAPWWLLPVPAAIAVLWPSALRITASRPGADAGAGMRDRPLVLLLVLLLAAGAAAASEAFAPGGGSTAQSTLGPVPVDVVILAMGLAVFLTVSSNALVRAALDRDAGRIAEPHVIAAPQLKGGRWIGPLERITLTGLLLAGAYPVAAGVIAAKGIVRFPEIQQDKKDGNKAEYFLVGSFVSWALAIAAAGLLWLAAH